jgi:phage shock protein E
MNTKEISAKAKAWVKSGALLLDVRTPEEYTQGHLEGAVNIPVQVLPQRIADVGAKDRPVVVYCMSGGRSQSAADLLKRSGFQEVLNLGPMSAW